MATLTSIYTAGELVWVVDPTLPTLYSGVIDSVVLSEYTSGGVTTNTLKYFIIIDQNSSILESLEEYITLTKQDGLTLLGTLVESGNCA